MVVYFQLFNLSSKLLFIFLLFNLYRNNIIITCFSRLHNKHIPMLSYYLTICYISLLVLLLILLPPVLKFKSYQINTVNIKDFPENFYCIDVIKEINKRFIKENNKREIDKMLNYKFGEDIERLINSFIDEPKNIIF